MTGAMFGFISKKKLKNYMDEICKYNRKNVLGQIIKTQFPKTNRDAMSTHKATRTARTIFIMLFAGTSTLEEMAGE